MSDHTDDRHGPPSAGPHPEDALAGYVDGTATLAERRAVDSHLSACAACRNDLELARSARVALGALSEVDPPALLLAADALEEGVVGAARSEALGGRGGVTPLRRRREGDAWGKAMGGLVAVAAAAAVILGAVVLLHGGSKSSTGAAGVRAAPQTSEPQFGGATETNYTPDSMDALAASIARTADQAASAPAPTNGANGAAESPTPAPAIENCARRASGASGSPLELISAKFKGRPAYVAAFREAAGDSSRVLVVAAQRGSCRLLYAVSVRVPATNP